MKLVILPPYKLLGVTYHASDTSKEGQFVIQEMLDNCARRGQLEGVDIEIADAYPRDNPSEARDEEFIGEITPGFVKRIRELSESGKYDAIVTNGSIEPGFFAAKEVSKIPVASGPHSAVHMASLVGERFSIIELRDVMAQTVSRYVTLWGFSHKLASIRVISRTSTRMLGYVHKYPKAERIKIPEIKIVVDDAVAQCIAAIEQDRADTLVIGCIPFQCIEDEIRQGLDAAGYEEIQLIPGVRAAIEMAKAMVNMKIMQARRAYPGEVLKRVPEFRKGY